MAKSCSTLGWFLIIFLVGSAALVMVPQAEARRQCSELLGSTCLPGKCMSACTSMHGHEGHGKCVHDEVGPGVSCQCYWFC
ncbi:hypothetical protein SAY87_001743 [Trapa incisa]|uniref:Uncharacterized protein n=1 Tax=Trapa incisa TaxID=236973 RepID=A0AAN7JT43_9MYRT|nr:hypothetical protein SAY87_001743 [Trapa incisa]